MSFSISQEPTARHFFNIYGACKDVDVDTRREVVIKTWETSANNRSFSISQEPTARHFSIIMVHAKLLMLIQDVKL